MGYPCAVDLFSNRQLTRDSLRTVVDFLRRAVVEPEYLVDVIVMACPHKTTLAGGWRTANHALANDPQVLQWPGTPITSGE
jgi:hypothetical protein